MVEKEHRRQATPAGSGRKGIDVPPSRPSTRSTSSHQEQLVNLGASVAVLKAEERSPAAACREAQEVEAIKKVFHKWDKNGSGTIEKGELTVVMSKILGEMSESDLDKLMNEADKDKNGEIELDEFVEWLMTPAFKSQGAAIFNYAEALRPIFDIYDRDKTGQISREEFTECHCILQGALRLNPLDDDAQIIHDPLDLQKTEEEAFREADRGGTGYIRFHQFIQWMQDHIPPHISHEELGSLCQKLATTLASVFKVVHMAESGQLGEEDSHILKTLLESLATNTRSFSKLMSQATAESTAHNWTEPPVGLSVERLTSAHMKYVPLNLHRVSKASLEVLCVPMPGEAHDRIWLGEVVRKVVYQDGRCVIERPGYYAYNRESFSWAPLVHSRACGGIAGGDAFEEALRALAPEVRLFCLLKTEANFGQELGWPRILTALDGGVDMEILSREQAIQYTKWMELKVWAVLKKEGHSEEAVPEFLRTRISLRPRAVMAQLTQLGIVQVSPVWEDFVNSD